MTGTWQAAEQYFPVFSTFGFRVLWQLLGLVHSLYSTSVGKIPIENMIVVHYYALNETHHRSGLGNIPVRQIADVHLNVLSPSRLHVGPRAGSARLFGFHWLPVFCPLQHHQSSESRPAAPQHKHRHCQRPADPVRLWLHCSQS